jgi:hypothetical protein
MDLAPTLVVAAIAVLVVAFLSGVVFEQKSSVSHREIIERDLGLYCPGTGHFAFVGECEE